MVRGDTLVFLLLSGGQVFSPSPLSTCLLCVCTDPRTRLGKLTAAPGLLSRFTMEGCCTLPSAFMLSPEVRSTQSLSLLAPPRRCATVWALSQPCTPVAWPAQHRTWPVPRVVSLFPRILLGTLGPLLTHTGDRSVVFPGYLSLALVSGDNDFGKQARKRFLHFLFWKSL